MMKISILIDVLVIRDFTKDILGNINWYFDTKYWLDENWLKLIEILEKKI